MSQSEAQNKLSYEDKQEFSQLLTNLKTNVDEVNDKIKPMIDKIRSNEINLNNGISYLEAKNNMLLIYITYLAYYSKLKIEGKTINDHPVIRKLIYLKTMLERTKSIDIKLKTQIDRLVKLSEESAENPSNANNETYRLRSQILNSEENEENEEIEDDNDEITDNSKKKDLKYKVQKNMMEYFETSNENKKKQKKLEKMKEKIRNSEYYEDMKNKLGDAPLEVRSHLNEVDRFNQQLEDFEDENFVRLKVPKKELKKLKKKDNASNDLLSHGKDLKNITNILDEDMNEEINEQIKSKNSRKMMNDQMKNYLGNKTIRNGKTKFISQAINEKKDKKFVAKMDKQKVWNKREFIRNKKQ